MPGPLLSFGAGVLLRCDDCGQALMAALTERGEAQLLHAVPVCEVFTEKAMRQAEHGVLRLLEPQDQVTDSGQPDT